ncbi:hypothetical protein [Bacillus cereus]
MKDLITTVLVATVVGTIVYFADNRLNDIYIALLVFIGIYSTVTICNHVFKRYDRKNDQ